MGSPTHHASATAAVKLDGDANTTVSRQGDARSQQRTERVTQPLHERLTSGRSGPESSFHATQGNGACRDQGE